MKPTRATVRKFLKDNSIATLATVNSDAQPISTPIFYLYTDDSKIRFITKDGTTKYKNMIKNEKVALSVIHKELPIAVNITGTAILIEGNDEIKNTLKELGKVQIDEYIQPVIKHRKGDFVVFEIEPLRIQYTDYTKPFKSNEDNIFDI